MSATAKHTPLGPDTEARIDAAVRPLREALREARDLALEARSRSTRPAEAQRFEEIARVAGRGLQPSREARE